MQMYIWNYGPKSLFVLSPSSIAGEYYSVENGFNPGNVPVPLAPGLIQSELVPVSYTHLDVYKRQVIVFMSKS